MNILGINFGHDASLALFCDGELVQFEELERASRLKHQYGVTSSQIFDFLERVNLTVNDINLASVCGTQAWALPHSDDIEISIGLFSEMHQEIFGKQFKFGAKSYLQGNSTGGDYYLNQLKAQNIQQATMSLVVEALQYPYLQGFDFSGEMLAKEFKKLIEMDEERLKKLQAEFLAPGTIRISGTQLPVFFVDHHYCHSNYAYFYSPKVQSIISTHDGGLPAYPFNSGGIYISNERGVIPIVDHRLFLGYLYDQISGYAQVGGDPGKLMGLSSYAVADTATLGTVKELIACTSRKFNQSEMDQLISTVINYSLNKSLIRINKKNKFKFGDQISLPHIQTAANAQSVVEGVFVHAIGSTASLIADIDDAYTTLNLTGGFTLNCPTNNLIKQKFQNLTINPLPGCGDTGESIGACVAIHAFLKINLKREQVGELSAAFPPFNFEAKFSDTDYISRNLKKLDYSGSIPEFIADAIIDKKILCIFRGRSEVGPRALGRRSIIAHAIYEDIRDRINISKGREVWRPLAPICRADDFTEYFDGDAYDSRYMLFTNRVKNLCLKGVIHVDGSARAQAISNQDEWLYDALDRIKSLGHIPVIINTSFNCAGEPIVESIQDAFRSFSAMNFDYLVTEYGIFGKVGLETK
jgi:carbamoyltransferase